ncbi:MAG: beta-ketoacyl-[acyl-carrier-protein] synthase II, partial [Phycisphaeraceae bacterium]|nr:beta-ketoacyl-[acyl-carrier-protein] synthase II [Phycisphaeraceae bacterium]
MPHRVVITGIGWVTPLGQDIATAWSAMLQGRSGIGPIRRFDASTFPTQFAAQVLDYDPTPLLRRPEYHQNIGLNTRFALGAAAQAWLDAGLDACHDLDHDRLGLYLGSGEGSMDFDNYVAASLAAWKADAKQVDTAAWAKLALERLNPLREYEQEPNLPLAHLAIEFEARGPAYNCLTACAASTQAMGEATQMLRRGDVDVMITGGSHSMIHPFGVTGF